MGLRHEIVLPTHTANNLSIFETVRDNRTGQGHHHSSVDEASVTALKRLERCIIDPIDSPHTIHGDLS